MRLNTLKPAAGAKSAAKRVGRGRGSGSGGTAGRGTKGQKSRSGGYHKVGFEGGQMPLQRRLPKRGFRSRIKRHTAEVRLHELAGVDGDVVDLQSLQKAGVIGRHITRAKAILSGQIERAVTLRGIGATKGARAAIEKAGGSVETFDKPKAGKLSKSGKSGKSGKADKSGNAKPKSDVANAANVTKGDTAEKPANADNADAQAAQGETAQGKTKGND